MSFAALTRSNICFYQLRISSWLRSRIGPVSRVLRTDKPNIGCREGLSHWKATIGYITCLGEEEVFSWLQCATSPLGANTSHKRLWGLRTWWLQKVRQSVSMSFTVTGIHESLSWVSSSMQSPHRGSSKNRDISTPVVWIVVKLNPFSAWKLNQTLPVSLLDYFAGPETG